MGVALNPNWNRWIYASVVKHFTEAAQAANIPIYIDRYDRDTDWAELRFAGPFIDEISRNCYLIRINVDIMLTTFVSNDDQYFIYRMTGIFAEAFKPICVYRYGDGPEDDDTLLGALKLTPRNGNKVNTINFGIILPNNKFQRSTVESDYEMYLS